MKFEKLTRRLPPRQEATTIFLACVIPVYFWSFIQLPYKIPNWILYLNTWDLIGVISYTLAFALFESLIIFFMLVALIVILPARFFRLSFVALPTMILFLTTFWAIMIHDFFDILYGIIGRWQYLLWIVLYIGSLAASLYIIQRNIRLQDMLISFNNQFRLLSIICVFISIPGIIMILIRNLI